MKQTLIIITALMLIVGFSSGQEHIDGSTLVRKDGLKYASGSEVPYSGVAVWYYDDGQKRGEGTYKDGEEDGKWTFYYENGQIKAEGKTINDLEDGRLLEMETYKCANPNCGQIHYRQKKY